MIQILNIRGGPDRAARGEYRIITTQHHIDKALGGIVDRLGGREVDVSHATFLRSTCFKARRAIVVSSPALVAIREHTRSTHNDDLLNAFALLQCAPQALVFLWMV